MPHTYSKDFEEFWRAFPNRVGKLAAEKAYVKARARASAEELLAGVTRYLRIKPGYAEFCHPATWLNQGRWLDEGPSPKAGSSSCPHDPQCRTRRDCIQRIIEDGRRARASA